MKHLFLFITVTLASCVLTAQNYGLDSTFGSNGLQTFKRGTGTSAIYDVEIQPDSRVITAGSIKNISQDMLLIRRTATGAADNTFGNAGVVHIDMGGDETANDMALQSDGKALVCGVKTQSSQVDKFVLLRLQKDGSPDKTFGNQGSVVFSFINGVNTSAAVFRNVRVQGDGKIVVGGYAYFNSEYRGVVQRYKSNGTLDSAFGTNGSSIIKFTDGSHNYCESVYLMRNGKILVLGSAYLNSFQHRLMRLQANGIPDSSFGVNGISANTLSGFNNVTPSWISELPDGKILTTGYAYNGSKQKIFATRYLSGGQPDIAFGTNGLSSYAATTGNNYAYDAYLHPNGDCSIPTESYNTNAPVAAIIKIDSLGNPSANFGVSGIKVYTFADYAYGNSVAADGDSLLLVGGINNQSDRFYQGYIAKVDHAGTALGSFAGNGIMKAGNGESGSSCTNLTGTSNGNLYITGTLDNMDKDQFVARLKANGQVFASFGSDGFTPFDLGDDEELEDAIVLASQSVLMVSRTTLQTIAFTSPVVTLTGAVRYSLSIIDSNGIAQTSTKKDFPITASQFTNVRAVRQDQNGKFIVFASSSQAVVSDFFLIRHNADFSIDNTYGNNSRIKIQGRTTSNFTGLGDIQIAPDNDVVVLNWFSNTFSKPFSNFTIKKYKENGSLDNNFANLGTFTNADTVGKDPSSSSHIFKFNNGYYVDYIKDGLAKIVHIGFTGSISNFGTIVLDSIQVADMKQLPDSSFIISGYKGAQIYIYHYFADGTRDLKFNNTGVIKYTPFINGKAIRGMAVNKDKSIVLYHQINIGNDPAYIALSKFSIKGPGNNSGISPLHIATGVSLYPNPFTNAVFVKITNSEIEISGFEFTLADLKGRTLPIRVANIDANTVYIESKLDLPPGTYILTGRNQIGKYISGKLIKN